jgi:hypothetical protein
MYKVVNIADLNLATNFIETDKVIEIDGTRTKMRVADNDYAHKNKSYLSNSIDTVEKAFNSYLDAIDSIYTTYLTSDISSVYLPKGSAISTKTLETILSSDAFLTKEKCKEIESECKAYIDELKNKAVSIIMAELNVSFIKQNSAGRLTYGQRGDTSYDTDYILDVTEIGIPTDNDYDFEKGEFSLANLLFGRAVGYAGNAHTSSSASISFSADDAWKDFYRKNKRSYTLNGTAENMLSGELSSYVVFNGNDDNYDYKIKVPECSFDFVKKQTIPIAQLIKGILKHQIKTVIKNVCDKYISKMTSVPTLTSRSNS